MNDSQLVMEHARKFAAQFSGFLKACEIIGNAGALEQLADEAQKRYDDIAGRADDLAGQHRAADEKMATASGTLEQATAQAALIKKIAGDEANEIRANAVSVMAEARAANIQERETALVAANASAAKIIADTHASLDDVKAQVAAQREALDALNNAVAARTAALEMLKQERSALLRQLQGIPE